MLGTCVTAGSGSGPCAWSLAVLYQEVLAALYSQGNLGKNSPTELKALGTPLAHSLRTTPHPVLQVPFQAPTWLGLHAFEAAHRPFLIEKVQV